MSTNTIVYVAVGGFIALPLLYLIVRKRKADKPSFLLGNITAAAMPSAPVFAAGFGPGPAFGKKRKSHRGGKKANKTKSHEALTKVESKPHAEAVIEQEFTDSITSAENERLRIAFSISTPKWMAGKYPESVDADVKKIQPIDEAGWETVGPKGKAVKKELGREETLMVLAICSSRAATETEDECTLAYPFDQVNRENKEDLTIDAYEASIHSTSSTASEFSREDFIQSTAENNITSDEDSHPTTPIMPTSSLAEQQELAMALKASLVESNNGWKTVGSRRKSDRRVTASSA